MSNRLFSMTRTEMPWTTDVAGRVSGFPMHDSTIVGLEYADGERLVITLRDHHGGTTLVELHDVGEMNLEGLCNGAIVSDLWAWKVMESPGWTSQTPVGGWNALYRSRYGDDAKRMAVRAADERPDALLVVLQCSYGGSLAAICSQITASREV